MGCVAGSLGVGPSAPVQAMVHSCIGGSLFQKPRLRGSLCRVPQASCRHLPHPAASAHRRSSHAWPVSVVACRRGSQDIGGLLWRRIISTLNQNPPGHRSGRLLSHPRLCRRPCHVCQDLFRKREPHEATITKNPPFPRGIATTPGTSHLWSCSLQGRCHGWCQRCH